MFLIFAHLAIAVIKQVTTDHLVIRLDVVIGIIVRLSSGLEIRTPVFISMTVGALT